MTTGATVAHPDQSTGADIFRGRRPRRLQTSPFGYMAPLDGLRAVALIGVMLYHSHFTWAAGGFLSLSAFFTLSGYLITSLLIREWAKSDTINLRGFWRRRFRRLLPASWMVIGIIIVMGVLGVWNDDQLRTMRGDVVFSLAEIVNWHFIAIDRSYGAEFAAPSPLTHFWSLAVEQQFYLFLPLLGLAALKAGRRGFARHRVRNLAIVMGVLAVISATLNGVLAQSDIDRAYFGTDTRAAEMFLGGLLACVTVRRLRLPTQLLRTLAVIAGTVAVIVTLWMWYTATLTSMWIYPWGFLLASLCTCLVILAALQGRLMARALSFGPLVAFGRISYGAYLLHWPIFLWLTPVRTGLGPWPLLGLRTAVTIVGATLLFRLLEDPIRRGARLRRGPWVTASALSVSAVALLGASFTLTSDVPPPSELTLAAAQVPADGEATTPPPAPIEALMIGDELTQSLSAALAQQDDWDLATATTPVCGLALGGWIRTADGTVERDPDRCLEAHERTKETAITDSPDTILLMPGMRDAADRRLSTETDWGGPGDETIDDFLRSGFGLRIDELDQSGSEILVVTMPPVRNTLAPEPVPVPAPVTGGPEAGELLGVMAATMQATAPGPGFAENDDARVARVNTILTEVAESRGLPVLDLAAHMDSLPGGALDPTLRPDGVGISPEGAEEISEWLAIQVRGAAPRSEPPAAAGLVGTDTPLPAAPELGPRRVIGPDDQMDVMVVGDSVAHNLGYGLTLWRDSGANLSVANGSQLGCPVARGGSYRFRGDVGDYSPNCEWNERFPDLVQAHRPDIVVIASGVWEVVDRQLIGDDRYRHIGDPIIDHYLLGELLTAIDTLSVDGATVVLVLQPTVRVGLDQGYQGLPESDPARIERWNQLLTQAAEARPGVTQVVDLRGWLQSQPGGEDNADVRPDGVHFTDSYVATIGAWLGPELRSIAQGDAG